MYKNITSVYSENCTLLPTTYLKYKTLYFIYKCQSTYNVLVLLLLLFSELIRDNMEALATRIDTWTMADARRFLMVTLPPNRRGAGRINHQSVERHLTRTHPMLLYAAIMGGPSVFPSGLSSMGSYEVQHVY